MRWILRTRLMAGIMLAGMAVFVSAPLAYAQAGRNPSLQKPAPGDEKQTPSLPPNDENLSRKLDRNDGVIKPPSDVDPEMHVPPKDPGAGDSMPVIPPPSGKGTIQPK
jgi:hypothetical protein